MNHQDTKAPGKNSICLFFFVSLCLGGEVNAAEKPWLEVRSPHFVVVSNAGEKQARRVAGQFEQIRAVFQKGWKVRVDPGQPFLILAVKDEKSLRELLPEFWETPGRTHPAGYFQGGPEKHYAALRLDARGDNPYHVLYHEYMHMLLKLNFRSLPLWLEEGLAEFYGYTVIGQKEVGLGRPSRSALMLLNQSRFLPLRTLFAVDRSSPEYSEANRASIFYAESWALTHFLVLGEKGEQKRLEAFVSLLLNEVPEGEALRRALGDLDALERALKDYIRQPTFQYARMEMPADTREEDFQLRELSPAASLAVRGDFLLHTKRPEEARALLQEALRLDPNLAQACESMGFLHFQKEERKEAARWFAQAVTLDSRSYLAHYYHAVLALQEPEEARSLEEVEKGLRRAIELNPDFAPAYSHLAGVYLRNGRKLEEALAVARKAAQLEPGEARHHLNVGGILLQMGRVEEAQKLAERLLAEAKSPQDHQVAQAFRESVAKYQEYTAESRRFEERRAAIEQERRRRLAELGKQAREQPPESPEEARPALKRRSTPQRASAEGRIGPVSCKGSVLETTLDISGARLMLRSRDFRKVNYTGEPPGPFDACKDLQGRRARVVYEVIPGSIYAVEIVSIEIMK